MAIRLCVLAIATLSLVGCAQDGNRVISLVPETAASPARGPAVRLERVVDGRSFELRPREANISSLLPDDFGKPTIMARAIGRQRDPFGKGQGEVLLPEGQTVTALFHDATANAFRRSGYRVLSPGDPGFDQATPVAVTVSTYWTWVVMGSFRKLSCRAEAEITAPIGALRDGLPVAGLAVQNDKGHPHGPGEPMNANGEADGITDADWRDIAGQCLAAYGGNVEAALAR